MAPVCTAVQRCSASLLSRAAAGGLRDVLGRPAPAPNAYTRFYAEQFPALRAREPALSVPEVGKRLGAAWRGLPPSERMAYEQAAAPAVQAARDARAAYAAGRTPRMALAASALLYDGRYRAGLIARADIPRDVRAFVRDMPAPPFATGRAMFIAEKLRGRPQALELVAGVSAEWDALSPAEKQSYESRARKDVANYRAALAKYVASEAPVSRDAASL